MKTLKTQILISFMFVSPAFASNDLTLENGFLIWAFLAFGAIILIGQLIPSIILFGSLIKGLFIEKDTKGELK